MFSHFQFISDILILALSKKIPGDHNGGDIIPVPSPGPGDGNENDPDLNLSFIIILSSIISFIIIFSFVSLIYYLFFNLNGFTNLSSGFGSGGSNRSNSSNVILPKALKVIEFGSQNKNFTDENQDFSIDETNNNTNNQKNRKNFKIIDENFNKSFKNFLNDLAISINEKSIYLTSLEFLKINNPILKFNFNPYSNNIDSLSLLIRDRGIHCFYFESWKNQIDDLNDSLIDSYNSIDSNIQEGSTNDISNIHINETSNERTPLLVNKISSEIISSTTDTNNNNTTDNNIKNDLSNAIENINYVQKLYNKIKQPPYRINELTEINFLTSEITSTILNLPLPVSNRKNETVYFETKLFEFNNSNTLISIGLSTKPYPNFQLPGYCPYSIAIESSGVLRMNNCPFSNNHDELNIVLPRLVEGDIIGFGYKPSYGSIFVTHNGRKVSEVIKNFKVELYPCIGSKGSPCKVQVNLGQLGFVFIEANVKKLGFCENNNEGTIGAPPNYLAVTNTKSKKEKTKSISVINELNNDNINTLNSGANVITADSEYIEVTPQDQDDSEMYIVDDENDDHHNEIDEDDEDDEDEDENNHNNDIILEQGEALPPDYPSEEESFFGRREVVKKFESSSLPVTKEDEDEIPQQQSQQDQQDQQVTALNETQTSIQEPVSDPPSYHSSDRENYPVNDNDEEVKEIKNHNDDVLAEEADEHKLESDDIEPTSEIENVISPNSKINSGLDPIGYESRINHLEDSNSQQIQEQEESEPIVDMSNAEAEQEQEEPQQEQQEQQHPHPLEQSIESLRSSEAASSNFNTPSPEPSELKQTNSNASKSKKKTSGNKKKGKKGKKSKTTFK